MIGLDAAANVKLLYEQIACGFGCKPHGCRWFNHELCFGGCVDLLLELLRIMFIRVTYCDESGGREPSELFQLKV